MCATGAGRAEAVPRSVLALNTGSSSVKFALFHPDGAPALRGQVEGVGGHPLLSAADAGDRALDPPAFPGSAHEDVLSALLPWIDEHLGGDTLAAVGHRIMHGGVRFADPVRLDDDVLAALDELVPLAPLHQPHGLAAVHAVARARPGLLQVGCFDTAFHRTMPPVAARLALPRALGEAGVRRYGFHGLSYEFVAGRLRGLAPDLAAGRVVVAHLGSGASLCAMSAGRSVETTMGFTALDGLVMGTRPGSLDPGVILYLLQSCGTTAAELEDLLYHRSGLLGVSGTSGDMRELAASGAAAAREAIELFVYRVAGETGRLAAALGGLDGFVFTAGIGERDDAVRAAVCERLAWLGVALDPAANAAGRGRISSGSSQVAVWIVPTDEEAVIARRTLALARADGIAP